MPTRTIEHKMVLETLNTHYWVPYSHIIDELKAKISPTRAKRAFHKENPDLYHLNDEDKIESGIRILLWDAADAALKAGDIEMRHEIAPVSDKVKVVWVRAAKLSVSYVDTLLHNSRNFPSPPSNNIVLDVDSTSYPNLVCISPRANNAVDMTFNYSFNNKFPLNTFKVLLSSATAVHIADLLQKYGLAINDFGGHDIDDPVPF